MTIILPDIERETARDLSEKALSVVDVLADEIRENQLSLQQNFLGIGKALVSVEENKHWVSRSHKSFSEYLKSVESRANKKRTQLYHCWGVAKDLLPLIAGKDLVAIGITKAVVLRKMLTEGHTPTPALIESAKNATEKQLKEQIAEATGLFLPQAEPDSEWSDLGQLILSPEETEFFLSVIRAAINAGEDAVRVEMETWKDFTDLSPGYRKELLLGRIFPEFLSGGQ